MAKIILKYSGWFLAAMIFLSFFATLSMAPLFDVDEGAFSEATREMLRSGNYLTTYLNGALRFDKPILVYWLQALSVTVFGIREFAFRLPSAITASLWSLGIFWFGRKYFDKTTAFLAAFMMVTSLQTTIIARAAIADALLNMCIAFSMFFLYGYFDTRQRKQLYLTFLAIGLGFLAKGPVALLIPLAVAFIYLLIKRELRLFWPTVFNPVGLAIFSLVALPWYVLEYLDQGMGFVEGFFFKHNLARFKTPFDGHGGSLLYYFPVVILGLLPYTTLLFRALARIKSWFASDLTLFLSIWFFFVFCFFSFSGTKLPHYVIYGYTPLFFLLAGAMKEVKTGFLFFLPVFVFFGVLLFLPELALFVRDMVTDAFAKVVITSAQVYFTPGYRLFFIFALGLLLFMSVGKKIDAITKIVILGIVTVTGVNFVVFTYGKIAQEPIQEAARIVKEHNYDVVLYGINTPSFLVATRKLVKTRVPRAGDIVLSRITKLTNIGRYDTIYQKNGIVLVRVKK